MAEGARLESVYTRKRIEGSNPSLTAKFKNKVLTKVGAFFFGYTAPFFIKVVPYGAKRLIG
ncbi:hypothetical [Yersinia pestis KIM10+]|uniref:Uncharacterized protein n=1 Tax=Yersinia pestis TaxID=632 RepID=Q8CL39_YERPE|nr:hypothetical [Yersinia pestis KIM10+]